MEFLSNIALAIMAPIIAFGGFIHDVVTPDPIIQVQYVPEYIEISSGEELNMGATVPSAVALYVDSLASAITANDTSFTLVRGTDKTGTALASSTYGFIIDEGSANEEMVLANCTGTVCTGVIRGINPVSGTSTTDSLKKSHRRGAIVKITDGPILITVSNILRGREGFGDVIRYDSDIATSSFLTAYDIIHKGYVDSVAFNGAGVVDATNATRGVSELAIGSEIAAGTAQGGSGVLVIPASQASSSRSVNAGVGVVPVTGSDGFLDDDFLPRTIATTTSFTSVASFSGTTTLSGMVYGGFYATATASTTFTGGSAPQAAFITASGTATTTSTSATSTQGFSGFAVTNAASGEVVKIQTDGIVSGFTGLNKGSVYYTSTEGSISTTITSNVVPVGMAISGTELLIQKGKRIYQYTSPTLTDSGNGGATVLTATINPGFIPRKITSYIAGNAGVASANNGPTYQFWSGGTLFGFSGGQYYISSITTPNNNGFTVTVIQSDASPVSSNMSLIIEE